MQLAQKGGIMDTIVMVKDQDKLLQPSDMPVLKTFEVQNYATMFRSPGRLDTRRFRWPELRYQWYHVQHDRESSTLYVGMVVRRDKVSRDTSIPGKGEL